MVFCWYSVCYTSAYPDLVPTPPKVSLIAAAPILSIVTQLIINFSMQMSTWLYTHQQPWYAFHLNASSVVADNALREAYFTDCLVYAYYIIYAEYDNVTVRSPKNFVGDTSEYNDCVGFLRIYLLFLILFARLLKMILNS